MSQNARMRTAIRGSLALLCTLALGGCYYLHLASGETRLLLKRKPITKVLADPATPPALKARLRLALQARAFASDHLDLPRNRSYTLYADIGRPYVMYNVFATPALSLQPVEHCFPIAGCVAYQGFYEKRRADAAADKLRKAGDDVDVEGVPAYSTLGHFADPVLSSMDRWSDDELVGTIFHELAHQKLYVKGDTTFNESFATFVQREGLREWYAARHEAPPDGAADRRRKQFTRLMLDTRRQLKKLYASDLPDAQKRQRKQATFAELRARYRKLRDTQWDGYDGYDAWMARPLNNARLLPFGLYDDRVPAFAALFARCGNDWPRFFAAAQKIAALPRAKRTAQLRTLAAAKDTNM